jgi:serine/threonine-protein kinase
MRSCATTDTSSAATPDLAPLVPQLRAHDNALTIAIIVLLAAMSIGLTACGRPAQPSVSASRPPPASSVPPAFRQTVLPLAGISNPGGVAVDAAGNVYVADTGNNRVVKLAAGSSTQTVLPFTGLNGPHGAAVDNSGNVYVADTGNKRVVKLAAGSSAQTVLPFTGLNGPHGVAVDNGGNVYLTDSGLGVVLKLAAG